MRPGAPGDTHIVLLPTKGRRMESLNYTVAWSQMLGNRSPLKKWEVLNAPQKILYWKWSRQPVDGGDVT